MMLHAGGRTFEIHQDLHEVTAMHRPDETWIFVDAQGHEHFWVFDGVRGPYSVNANASVPSVVFVKTGEEYWEDDDEPHAVGYEACVQCGEKVVPRFCADQYTQYVRGLKRYRVDGESVSREAFLVVMKEAGVPIDEWGIR